MNPIGVQWEAVEFIEDNKIGYLFQTHQDFEEEDNAALERLYDKIKKGLSQRFIEKEVSFGREYFHLENDRAEGRIEWDEDYEGDRIYFLASRIRLMTCYCIFIFKLLYRFKVFYKGMSINRYSSFKMPYS